MTSSAHPSADPDATAASLEQRRFVTGEPQVPHQHVHGMVVAPDTGGQDLLSLSTNSAPAAAPAAATPGLAPAFGAGPLTIDTLQASSMMSSLLTAPQSAPPTTMDDGLPLPYNDMVRAAITLLQKRLPIMGAALSTSESESGQDEEEIWKGIEGAYEELKRIMLDRKETRRHAGTGVGSKVRLF